MQSSVGSGPSQAIAPDQVHQAFGADTITAMATKADMSPQELVSKLSSVLPQVMDKLAPGGVVAT